MPPGGSQASSASRSTRASNTRLTGARTKREARSVLGIGGAYPGPGPATARSRGARSDHEAAAAADDGSLTAHETGSLGGEEADDMSDVFWCPHAAGRDGRQVGGDRC